MVLCLCWGFRLNVLFSGGGGEGDTSDYFSEVKLPLQVNEMDFLWSVCTQPSQVATWRTALA